jgi:redox-sensing transcriptional repressor
MADLICSEGMIQRLSHYLRHVVTLKDQGKRTVTSQNISDITKINSAEVRRDLIYFGVKGRRGVGFNIDDLIKTFNRILGHEENVRIVLVGAGNLGRAILNYKMLNKFGFIIENVFDNDKEIIGKKISEKEIMDISLMKAIIKDKSLKVAILAVSTNSAQYVANLLVDSGIKVIINYTSMPVKVPSNIIVQAADPIEILLHTLYYLSRTGKTF